MDFNEHMINYLDIFLNSTEIELEEKIKLVPQEDLEIINTLSWKIFRLTSRECNTREKYSIDLNRRGEGC